MRLAQLLVAIIALLAVGCGGGATKIECTPGNDDCHNDTNGVTYTCDSISLVCLRTCSDSTTCLASQHCDTAAGVCRDGTSTGGDPAAGDPAAGDPAAGDPTTGD